MMDRGVMATDFEHADCPKCGSSQGLVVAIGRDHLYGVPGKFQVWECSTCGLQFQNPRPVRERLADLYPTTYGPHAELRVEGERATSPSSRNDKLRRVRPIAAIWPVLHAGRSALRSAGGKMRRRWSLSPWRHLIRAGVVQHMRTQMGYTHLGAEERGIEIPVGALLRRARARHALIELIPDFVAGGRVLEIGCATGERLKTLREWGWHRLEGIELVSAAADQARQAGFEVRSEPVEVALREYENASVDVIIMSMVIEHLQDPFDVVRTIARKLRPGGQFLFSTVTRDSLDARLYGAFWGGYDFPRHMVHFRQSDLHEMLADHFEQIRHLHQNAPVDFARSAAWRRQEGRLTDRAVLLLARSPLAALTGWALAVSGQSCRVSFRCVRRADAA